MSYQTDYPPIEYLQRRLKYYKKKRTFIDNTLRNRRIEQYTEEEQNELVDARLAAIDIFIKEYETAITLLERIYRRRIED